MDVEFKDKRLALIETDRAAETRLPPEVIRSCQHKLHYIRQAKDERDIRNWKSLHFERMKGKLEGQLTIRLNDQWRLFFEFERDGERTKFVVLKVDDPH